MCDGWHLVKQDGLSVLHERMPMNTSEARHYHEKARQFFFVLSGVATLEVDGELLTIEPQQGVEVSPGTPHQMMNRSNGELEFLVISSPNTKGDRINC